MKVCNRCEIKKAPRHYFKRNKRSRFGICKKCTRKSKKIYRRKNRVLLAERDKKRNKKRQPQRAEQRKLYRRLNRNRLLRKDRLRYRKQRRKICYQNMAYYHKNAKSISKWRREYKYGLSDTGFTKMLREQKGSCKICGRTPGKKPLHVDHDHITKKVRGLLCNRCNLGLGLFSDSLKVVKKAVAYLEEALR